MRETAEKNIQRLRQNEKQYFQSQLPQIDAKNMGSETKNKIENFQTKIQRPTRIGSGVQKAALPTAPPLSFEKYAQNFKQEYFQSKFNLESMVKPKVVEAPKEEEIDLDALDKRFENYFAGIGQREVPAPAEEEVMQKTSNLDGLDLELSQSTSAFQKFTNQLQQEGKKEKVIEKNDLLDSLDLNVGMETIFKLQDVWN